MARASCVEAAVGARPRQVGAPAIRLFALSGAVGFVALLYVGATRGDSSR